jgi:hypothetical protein
VSLVPVKKVSALSDVLRLRKGAIRGGLFRPLGAQGLPEESVLESWVYDNFCSTHQGLSTLKVSENFVELFSKSGEKVGGPLNEQVSY